MTCAPVTTCTCSLDLQPLQLGRRPEFSCAAPTQPPARPEHHQPAFNRDSAQAPHAHDPSHDARARGYPCGHALGPSNNTLTDLYDEHHQPFNNPRGNGYGSHRPGNAFAPPLPSGEAPFGQDQRANTSTEEARRRAPHPGIIVGDYQLGRTLGVGASGKVKYAIHLPSGHPVAIKIIRKSLLENKPAVAAKIRREIAVLKLLGGAAAQRNCTNNVGVLALFDVYETEQCILLILEYCPGGDLFEVLVDCGYLSNDDALNVFQQLVYALYFCHRQGIAHRDLKLENILIDSNGRLKLADFGMASMMTPGSLLETACGSPNYCAPEVLAGGLYNGARSDIWSLGIILYVLVTGGLPFDDDNFSRLLAKIQAGIFHLPEAVEPQVASLIEAMLRVNPEERISLLDIMQSPWFQSQPPSSRPSNPDLMPRKEIPCHSSMTVDYDRSQTPSAEPILEPHMPFVLHLTHLGLGDIPMILRRLRSKRSCIEKDFYTRIAAFVSQPLLTHISNEVPPSPGVGTARQESPSSSSGLIAPESFPVRCPSLTELDSLPACIAPSI